MNIDVKYIKELAELLEDSQLTEIALEDGDKALVLKKEKELMAAAAPVVASVAPQVAAPQAAPQAEAPAVVAEAPKGKPVKSPMVGTFYKASAPGAAPFVEVGKTVSEGDTVCIIEAMKLMNEIEAEVSGKIVEICVEDGQAVEFGQVLMYVE